MRACFEGEIRESGLGHIIRGHNYPRDFVFWSSALDSRILFISTNFPRFSVTARWVESLCDRRAYSWAIRSPVRSFARTAHSFAWSALLASFARYAALIFLLALSLRSSWKRGFCLRNERVDFIQFQPTVHCSESLNARIQRSSNAIGEDQTKSISLHRDWLILYV